MNRESQQLLSLVHTLDAASPADLKDAERQLREFYNDFTVRASQRVIMRELAKVVRKAQR